MGLIRITRVGSVFSVNFDIKDVKKLSKSLVKDLKSVKGARAGVIDSKRRYPDSDGKKGMLVKDVALINEFGAVIPVTPKMKGWFYHQGVQKSDRPIVIPPRPFMRNAIKDNEKYWVRFVKNSFDADQSNGMTLKQIATKLSERMKKDIIESIESNIPPPNSKFTIARKRGSTKTLRDTGYLIDSIKNEVIKGNDRT